MIDILVTVLVGLLLTAALSLAVPFFLRIAYSTIAHFHPAIGASLAEQYQDVVAELPRIAQLHESLVLLLQLPFHLSNELVSHRRAPDLEGAARPPTLSVPRPISLGARLLLSPHGRLDQLDFLVMLALAAASLASGVGWVAVLIPAVPPARRSCAFLLDVFVLARRHARRIVAASALLVAIASIPWVVINSGSLLIFCLGDSWWNWAAGAIWAISLGYQERIDARLLRAMNHPIVIRGVTRLLRIA